MRNDRSPSPCVHRRAASIRRTVSPQGVMTMKFVNVAHAAGKWFVSVENEVPLSFGTRGQAVVAALGIARRVHQQERQPAAVRALLSSGEWSVLSRFDNPG
jgi:hypothetical protein